MCKPHVHAELIKQWADGAEIQLKTIKECWVDVEDPAWCVDIKYRVKPERHFKHDSFYFACYGYTPEIVQYDADTERFYLAGCANGSVISDFEFIGSEVMFPPQFAELS